MTTSETMSANADDINDYERRFDKANALYEACKDDDMLGTVKHLLKNGDRTSSYGRALCYASENGNDNIVKYLLDMGANVHAYNDEPIRLASECGWTKTVKILLDAGADMSANNHEAMTLAEMRGRTEVITLLKERADK